ncbi:hypothetical protein ACFPM7_08815 [Actinokineospora guangxiensis]|uniref:Uncharacterized protein n=1 Tax=Actinokineospora guangxiensis TaxID=1490288 RepID=A0ABW0EIA7_9PSEU
MAGHERPAARITAGLEPSLVDNAPLLLTSFSEEDIREFTLRVAGPAALLAAKAVKIGERLKDAEAGRADRVKEKDALDMFRLLQATDTESLVEAITLHTADPHAKPTTQRALQVLKAHGTTVSGVLPALATTAAGGDPVVAPSFVALVDELVDALSSACPQLTLA